MLGGGSHPRQTGVGAPNESPSARGIFPNLGLVVAPPVFPTRIGNRGNNAFQFPRPNPPVVHPSRKHRSFFLESDFLDDFPPRDEGAAGDWAA